MLRGSGVSTRWVSVVPGLGNQIAQNCARVPSSTGRHALRVAALAEKGANTSGGDDGSALASLLRGGRALLGGGLLGGGHRGRKSGLHKRRSEQKTTKMALEEWSDQRIAARKRNSQPTNTGVVLHVSSERKRPAPVAIACALQGARQKAVSYSFAPAKRTQAIPRLTHSHIPVCSSAASSAYA